MFLALSCGLGTPLAAPLSAQPTAIDPAQCADTPLCAQTFRLENGLKVVVHESRRAPLVTVQVVYDVGSLDEPAGKHGLAHLFEHLMFAGSDRIGGNVFDVMRSIGATDTNGTTNPDRTVFYATVPRAALRQALFVEAERMGHFMDTITPQIVQREIDVVLNELNQRRGGPTGGVWESIFADMYPAGHPYHHTTGGSPEDLRAVTLEDARAWFDAYYGAANATLILTGDIGPEEARAMVEEFFADAPPGPPVERPRRNAPSLDSTILRETSRRGATASFYRHYMAPPAGDIDMAYLDLAMQSLAGDSSARLHRVLVDELGLARNVTASFGEHLLSSQLGFIVELAPGASVAETATALEDALARFIAEGPTDDELARARSSRLTVLASLLDTGLGQSIMLARGIVFTGDPDHYANEYPAAIREARPSDVQAAAAGVFARPYHQLNIRPFVAQGGAPAGYDRALGMPPPDASAPVTVPQSDQFSLSNGLSVVHVRRADDQISTALLQGPRPTAADPAESIAQQAAIELLGMPATAAPEDGVDFDQLGARFSATLEPDLFRARLSVLAENLDRALAMLATRLAASQPSPAAFDTARQRMRRSIAGTQSGSPSLALDLLRSELYGPDHPYAAPPIAARLAALDGLSSARTGAAHGALFDPTRATLFIASQLETPDLRALLEQTFSAWAASAAPSVPAASQPRLATPSFEREGPELIVIDQPGATQTQIFAGQLIPESGTIDDAAIEAVNRIFGGTSSARINRELRGARGWSYGIGSGATSAIGPRLMQIGGAVQLDRTADALDLLRTMVTAFGNDQPPSQAELDRIVAELRASQASRLESSADLLTEMADAAFFRPGMANPLVETIEGVAGTPLSRVAEMAPEIFDRDRMVWVIVTDWSLVESQFEQREWDGMRVD